MSLNLAYPIEPNSKIAKIKDIIHSFNHLYSKYLLGFDYVFNSVHDMGTKKRF